MEVAAITEKEWDDPTEKALVESRPLLSPPICVYAVYKEKLNES